MEQLCCWANRHLRAVSGVEAEAASYVCHSAACSVWIMVSSMTKPYWTGSRSLWLHSVAVASEQFGCWNCLGLGIRHLNRRNTTNHATLRHFAKLSPLKCCGLFVRLYQLWLECEPEHSITKNFLCITHIVEHNYISSSSTLGLQLHVSVLYVGHLQVVTWLSE